MPNEGKVGTCGALRDEVSVIRDDLASHHMPNKKYMKQFGIKGHDGISIMVKQPTLGFKSMKTAYRTIKGFEIMRMFKKGRFDLWKYGQGIYGEIRIIADNLLEY